MVYGLDKFRETFRPFTNNYVIIGGTACDQMLSKTAIEPRATEDIDMIVVVEAINDDYYRLTLEHSVLDDGIRVADFKALVCLKAKAYLNMVADREAGTHRNTKDIKKHRLDVLKLTAGDPDTRPTVVGDKIAGDIQDFVSRVDVLEMRKALKDSIKVDDAALDAYLDILRNNYLPR